VRPPFFRRPGFLVPAATLVILVTLLLSGRLRYAATLRQREEGYRRHLEQRVDERTEALRESEERLRLLLETTHVIPWVADADTWDFSYVGPQAVDVLGYPVERWYEAGFWLDNIHPEDAESAVSYCTRQSQISDRYEFEYRMIAADGSTVWLHDLVTVVSDEGEPTALRGFLIDITARKQAESERIEAEAEALEHRERLAHLSRVNMLGEMATGIAHEVNQPLTAVSTYTQACRRMIEAGTIGTDEIIDVLGRISEEAVRAGDMIHGLKALARKRRSEMQVCDINRLVRDVIPLAEVEARHRGVAVDLELGNHLPGVTVDDVQIQQVVLNLVRNAIEAARPGDGHVTVRTRRGGDDAIEVEVTDNGRGVVDGDPEQVFQPFVTTKQDGMGMGLSISRSIIDAHGGQIGHRSGDPTGTTFFFLLPTGSAPPTAVS
jgi:two-component system sensor kinase FixL